MPIFNKTNNSPEYVVIIIVLKIVNNMKLEKILINSYSVFINIICDINIKKIEIKNIKINFELFLIFFMRKKQETKNKTGI